MFDYDVGWWLRALMSMQVSIGWLDEGVEFGCLLPFVVCFVVRRSSHGSIKSPLPSFCSIASRVSVDETSTVISWRFYWWLHFFVVAILSQRRRWGELGGVCVHGRIVDLGCGSQLILAINLPLPINAIGFVGGLWDFFRINGFENSGVLIILLNGDSWPLTFPCP